MARALNENNTGYFQRHLKKIEKRNFCLRETETGLKKENFRAKKGAVKNQTKEPWLP